MNCVLLNLFQCLIPPPFFLENFKQTYFYSTILEQVLFYKLPTEVISTLLFLEQVLVLTNLLSCTH